MQRNENFRCGLIDCSALSGISALVNDIKKLIVEDRGGLPRLVGSTPIATKVDASIGKDRIQESEAEAYRRTISWGAPQNHVLQRT